MSVIMADQTQQTDPIKQYDQPDTDEQQSHPGRTVEMEDQPDHGEDSYRGSDRLTGKRAVITGGDSGIGRAVALAFAREGADVVLSYLAEEEADAGETVRLIEDAGRRAVRCPGDLREEDACQQLVDTAVAELGGIDILVNNAGRSIRRPLEESLDRWHDVERTMTLNYYGPLRLIRGFAPGMLHRRDGHIINVSTWGVKTESPPLFGVYNASKAALSSVSRIIETEWAGRGVHSTTLYYPLVKTPMIAPTRAYDGLPGLSAEEAAGWIITAARHRPVSIAPRIAVTAHAVNSIAPAAVDTLMRRQRMQPKD